jgi:hypothetical protein
MTHLEIMLCPIYPKKIHQSLKNTKMTSMALYAKLGPMLYRKLESQQTMIYPKLKMEELLVGFPYTNLLLTYKGLNLNYKSYLMWSPLEIEINKSTRPSSEVILTLSKANKKLAIKTNPSETGTSLFSKTPRNSKLSNKLLNSPKRSNKRRSLHFMQNSVKKDN